MSIYSHIFDQFQRYQTASRIVSNISSEKKAKILEVGANGHFNLKEYIPNSDITFSDINMHEAPDDIKFIQADATNLPFNDDEFDFVISLDVLEHVPVDDREKVIAECTRVSSKAFILACPVYNQGKTEKAERGANDFFKKLHGIDHLWLTEHFEEGLPSLDGINALIKRAGVPFHSFQTGQLEWWELLMKMHFVETADARFKPSTDALYELYNRYLYAQDTGGDCYRTFWIIGEDSSQYSINMEKPTELSKSAMKQLQATFSYLETILEDNMQLKHVQVDLKCAIEEKITQAEQAQQNEAQLVASNAHLNEVILALRTSTSWRLTAPLRAMSYLAKGDRQAIKNGIFHRIPLVARLCQPEGGGFKGRLKRAFSLLVKQGPKAFFRQFSKFNNVSINAQHHHNNESNYQLWLDHHSEKELTDAAQVIGALSKVEGPLISVVMPTYNTDEKFLRLCIDSVCNQSYPNWELCIADDASPQSQVQKVLDEYQRKDPRIKVVYRKENGHISAATNSAINLATGEWLALLDHDDELHEHALAFVAHSIIIKPNTELVYTDEDKIDVEGNRSEPHFKPDWNLDLLYSQNYVSHLGVYKTEIVKQIGGFRVGYEGSQDYDLLLRYSREIDHNNIMHIPKALYHWRMLEGSTALASGEKSYTTEAGIKALQDHFYQLGESVKVTKGLADNIYKVTWPTGEDFVSLIIPTYNGLDITKQAINSIIQKTSYSNYEIILVDNNSDDAATLSYFDEIEKHEKVTLLKYPHPFNYSAINNFAVKQCKGDIIGLINNDIEVINSDWLTEMVSQARRQEIGCVGAMLYYPNDTIQHAGVIIGLGGVAGHSHKSFPKGSHGYFRRLEVVQNVSAVTAACLLVRKSVFDEVGGLNERDLTVAFNDVDFCLKVQAAGYRNLWTPYSELYHHESISRGAEDNPEKIARFNKEVDFMMSTWETDKIADFAYNPNLSKDHANFDLATQSRYEVSRIKDPMSHKSRS